MTGLNGCGGLHLTAVQYSEFSGFSKRLKGEELKKGREGMKVWDY
jgi:hypothetical protein